MIILSGAGDVSSEPPDPSTIANLELWLHPRNITAGNGNPIDTWPDSSGNARDATAVAGARPTYHSSGGANGQPYAQADGTDDAMQLPDFATGFTAGHLFIVLQIDNDPPGATGQSGCPFRASTSAGDASFYPDTLGDIYENWGSTTRKTIGNPALNLTTWHVYEVLSKSGAYTVWHNGTQIFTTATNTVGFTTVLRLFLNANANRMDGNMSELIFFSRDITGGEVTTVKTYLNFWYGITIA